MINAEPSDSGSHFCIFNCMKIFLLFLTICFALANAQLYYDKHGECRGAYKDSLDHATLVKFAEKIRGPILVKKPIKGVKPKKNLKKIPENKIQRTLNVSRDTLDKENWLEVEKNEIVKICVDQKVLAWETSLSSKIKNDSCLAIQAPTLIGVESINIYFPDADSSFKINLAVGMKYLDFQDEKVLLGYNRIEKGRDRSEIDVEFDPERFASITGTYLVDKYPITNCEFTQLMWDSIPDKTTHVHPFYKMLQEEWISRKRSGKYNAKCMTRDSAATTVFLYQSMLYANARSIREGLKPYYIFSKAGTDIENTKIFFNRQSDDIAGYIVDYKDFVKHEDEYIIVKTDNSSDGYRLPYYDEWMMLARGGDKKNKAPWGDSTATFKEASKYAKFKSIKGRDYYASEKEIELSEHVGQLRPNGYGLYDVFGLVGERVLLERARYFVSSFGIHYFNFNLPSCLKGGQYLVSEKHIFGVSNTIPYWKYFNYGYYEPGYQGLPGGFRLIRNIGNNAKWTEVKSK